MIRMAVFTSGSVNRNSKVEVVNSPVFEMMACLRKCYTTAGEVKDFQTFYRKHQAEIDRFYGGFELGAQFAELAVDLPQPHTLERFLKYVESMERETFLYYLFGRYLSGEQLKTIFCDAEDPSVEVSRQIQQMGGWVNDEQLAFAEHFPEWSQSLLMLWRSFQQDFPDFEMRYKPVWDEANFHLKRELKQKEPEVLIRSLLKGYDIPEQFPGKDTRVIRFYPSYFVSPRFIMIWGWGELHIVYDALLYGKSGMVQEVGIRYDDTDQLKEHLADDLATVSKALSEPVRLKIMMLVAQRENIKAQEMAQILNITPATVSRHLAQLKQNGLIVEHRDGGYNTYTINRGELEKWYGSLRKMLGIS